MSEVGKINVSIERGLSKNIENYTKKLLQERKSLSNNSAYSTNIEEFQLEDIGKETFAIQNEPGIIENIKDNIGDFLESTGDFFSETACDIGEGINSIVDKIDTGWNDIKDHWDQNIAPLVIEGGEQIGTFLERTSATIGTSATSIVEGVLGVGESLIDFLVLAGTTGATAITGIIDLGQALGGLLTGNDWDSLTKQLWEQTKDFVSIEGVKTAFDDMYENTEYGKWLKENSYAFDTARGIGNGIGYTAGILGLSILTFGGGEVAISSSQLATTAGRIGLSKGTESSWADGAGILEGLAYGGASGVWEGIQYFLGAKIGGLNLFGEGGKFLTNLGAEEIKTKIINSLGRVVLDGADGGIEGFIQPMLGSIYKDGNYSELFNEYGGWQNVLTQATVGSIMSTLGEGFDLGKYFNDSKQASTKKNIDVSPPEGYRPKNIDISPPEGYHPKNIDISPPEGYHPKNVDIERPNLESIEKEISEQTIDLLTEEITQELPTLDIEENVTEGPPPLDIEQNVAEEPPSLDVDNKIIEELSTQRAEETRKKIASIKQPDLTKYQKYVDRANRVAKNINKLEIVDNLADKEVNPWQIVKRIENKIFKLNKKEIISFGIDKAGCENYFEYDNNMKEFLQSLPWETKQAVIKYSNIYYSEINNEFLRKYKGQIKDKLDTLFDDNSIQKRAMVKQLDDLVARTPLPEDMILYRGCDIRQFKDLGIGPEDDLKMLTGANLVLEDYGIMSTTPVITAGFVPWKPIVLVIRAEKGTNCSYIDPISSAKGEDEVILERGQKGIISGVEKIGEQYYVYMELLPKEKTDTNITEVNEINSTISNKIKVPEISSKSDLETYLSDEFIIKNDNPKVYREEINTAVEAINNYINHQIENKETSLDEVYYLLLEMTGWEMNQDIKTDIISNLINSNQKIREALSENAKTEISLSLENTFGITDENMVNEVYNCLVGSEFVEKGIGANADWDKYIDIIKPYATEKVQILSKEKEPVLWSKIENDYHPILNEKYTTIENSTIGEDMYFLDLIYSNWDRQTTSIPPLENLWAKLSKIYADACCEVKDPITNVNVDTISYLYPETINVENSFGKLFKTIEFPEILHNGTIKNINLTKVNPTTLEPVSTETVDISDIIDYYQNANCGMHLEDISSNEEAFKIFLNKIKGEK